MQIRLSYRRIVSVFRWKRQGGIRIYIYIYVRNEGPRVCIRAPPRQERGYMHRCTCATTRGCMMYIRHRVRRAVANMQNRWRGGDLTPGEAGPLFSFPCPRVAIVFQGPPSNDLRGRKSYARYHHPFFLLNEEKNRSTDDSIFKTNGISRPERIFEEEMSSRVVVVIRAKRYYRLF